MFPEDVTNLGYTDIAPHKIKLLHQAHCNYCVPCVATTRGQCTEWHITCGTIISRSAYALECTPRAVLTFEEGRTLPVGQLWSEGGWHIVAWLRPQKGRFGVQIAIMACNLGIESPYCPEKACQKHKEHPAKYLGNTIEAFRLWQKRWVADGALRQSE